MGDGIILERMRAWIEAVVPAEKRDEAERLMVRYVDENGNDVLKRGFQTIAELSGVWFE